MRKLKLIRFLEIIEDHIPLNQLTSRPDYDDQHFNICIGDKEYIDTHDHFNDKGTDLVVPRLHKVAESEYATDTIQTLEEVKKYLLSLGMIELKE